MARLIGIATRPAAHAPMQICEAVAVTTERGVGDDARGSPGPRQVTVLSKEAWEQACAEAGARLPWTARRANLLVEGLSFEATTGRRLRIGSVVLEICVETDPCRLMDAQHPGLRAAMEKAWRGGASCRVVSGGTVALGDVAELED